MCCVYSIIFKFNTTKLKLSELNSTLIRFQSHLFISKCYGVIWAHRKNTSFLKDIEKNIGFSILSSVFTYFTPIIDVGFFGLMEWSRHSRSLCQNTPYGVISIFNVVGAVCCAFLFFFSSFSHRQTPPSMRDYCICLCLLLRFPDAF